MRWFFCWVILWSVFAVVATRSWYQTSEPWSMWWFFDGSMHFIFGALSAFNIVSYYKNFYKNGFRPFSSRRPLWRMFFAALVIAIIFSAGWLWELIENLWDAHIQPSFFPWLGKAQYGQLDTLIDLALNPFGAGAALKIYFWGERQLYSSFYRDALEEAEVGEILDEMESCATRLNELSEKLKNSKKKIKIEFVRMQRKKIVQALKRLSRLPENGK